MAEWNFDGLTGPTHHYAGLSPGNVASERHRGQVASPRAAALQGLGKMRRLMELGVPQAVLPPHERPHLPSLRALGLCGTDAEVLARAAQGDGHLLRLVSSASAMWTANAATVAPSSDTLDGRVHLLPANLSAMFHRSLEAPLTTRVLRRVFADEARYCVHEPLPPGSHFADEGAANHTRLVTEQGTVHVFGWGRRAWGTTPGAGPQRYPARQTEEASLAAARLLALPEALVLPWQQAARGIDAGGFHTDVLAVGHRRWLLLHELAFEAPDALLTELRQRLGAELEVVWAAESALPVAEAVAAYPFNSQLVSGGDGTRHLIAPSESQQAPRAAAYLQRLVDEGVVAAIHYLDLNASMNNGGGPACLRLRVELSDAESAALGADVTLTPARLAQLEAWVERHYRERLSLADLADPLLLEETRSALDALTGLLGLGSLYDFQR